MEPQHDKHLNEVLKEPKQPQYHQELSAIHPASGQEEQTKSL